ncbi:hypothetical protein [Dyella sp.]|uniref:arsenate reductase/protein-tyrosine-phosphatase family protein n=1 Tax=Dyella sp. TaxID=1869338 RepID=UPI003217F9E2
MIRSVLFVCVGNLCRSPMAACMARHAMPWLHIDSAGLRAPPAQPAHPLAISAMDDWGVDLSAHRTKRLTRELASRHDLILTMDEMLRELIHQQHPSLRGRVQLMESAPIADPYGQPRTAFDACRRQLAGAVETWAARLASLTAPPAGAAR